MLAMSIGCCTVDDIDMTDVKKEVKAKMQTQGFGTDTCAQNAWQITPVTILSLVSGRQQLLILFRI